MTVRRAIWLLVALLFLWRLGGHDLWAPDEPYFAEGAREMVVDGEWAVPHVNGKVTTDKPPLFFWLIALFSLPLGEVTPWTARLPSALAGLTTVALTMRLGGRFFGPRSAGLAGLILATSYLFWEKARWSQTDAVLCSLIWLALSAFLAFRAGDATGRRAGLLFWLAAALAVLVKGPVGVLLPLGIVLVTLGVDGELGRWRQFAPATGPLLFAAVVGAWMVLATVGGQGEYSVWGALQEHFVNRGIEGMHHKQPPWYYLEVLPVQLLPWTGLIPGALLLAWRRRRSADRFLLVAALFVVVFFSVSTEKRELYALPAFPAFALMLAGLVSVVAGWGEPADGAEPAVDRRWLTVGQGVLGTLLTAVGLALPLAARRLDEAPYWMALVLGMLLVAVGLSTLYLLRRGRVLAAVVAPAIGVAVAYLLVVTAVYPALEPRKSARPFALSMKEATADSRARGLPVVAHGLGNLPEAFAFYTNGLYTQETDDPGVLADHLDRRQQVFAVVNRGHVGDLSPQLRRRLFVVDATRLSRRDVLLITNGSYPGARPLEILRSDEE